MENRSCLTSSAPPILQLKTRDHDISKNNYNGMNTQTSYPQLSNSRSPDQLYRDHKTLIEQSYYVQPPNVPSELSRKIPEVLVPSELSRKVPGDQRIARVLGFHPRFPEVLSQTQDLNPELTRKIYTEMNLPLTSSFPDCSHEWSPEMDNGLGSGMKSQVHVEVTTSLNNTNDNVDQYRREQYVRYMNPQKLYINDLIENLYCGFIYPPVCGSDVYRESLGETHLCYGHNNFIGEVVEKVHQMLYC